MTSNQSRGAQSAQFTKRGKQERMSSAEYRGQPKAKRSKYGNTRVTVDGIRFDSKAESERWFTLKLWQQQGIIYNLRRQVTYKLLGAAGEVACRYKADFDYFDTGTGQPVTEDVKGFETDVFKLKARMFRNQFGREIKVVK